MAGSADFVFDASWGSSGKGKLAPYLARANDSTYTAYSTSNYPNAGHTHVEGDRVVVVKVLPSASAWNGNKPVLISPGSGFFLNQLFAEWLVCRRPQIYIHERAQVLTDDHRKRENADNGTRNIASTMQGTGAAIIDKISRGQLGLMSIIGSYNKADIYKTIVDNVVQTDLITMLNKADMGGVAGTISPLEIKKLAQHFCESIEIMSALSFRKMAQNSRLLHEVSQGWALSIDHGTQYPWTTSRNCGVAAAIDQLGISPRSVQRVVANVRSYPIRVGNFYETRNGEQVLIGTSGPFTPNSRELTWDDVGREAGMPDVEIAKLTENERTTVTKRVRRVATLDLEQIVDACESNGATSVALNFAQYISWSDHKKRQTFKGDRAAFDGLSEKTRHFVEAIESATKLTVGYIGTGRDIDDMVERYAH